MFEALTITSHRGRYTVDFDEEALERVNAKLPEAAHFIIDRRVAELYSKKMQKVLASPSVLLIDAIEINKSLNKFPGYVDHLVSHGVQRDHVLIAIGGGIIQDLTCFLAATILRGVRWEFFPTTLLAQADSCIGSKSSINNGATKNILGTFTPPDNIYVATSFLDTLNDREVRSGVGEMLKVHAIDGPKSFDAIVADYDALFNDRETMVRYVRRSLEIKKSYIEADEFDRGPRNIFNYGHTFGHAIEAATDFSIPHGIAITIGMDMANWISFKMGIGTVDNYDRMHHTLAANYRGFENVRVPIELFIKAISKDKKNIGSGVTLILPNSDGYIFRDSYPNDFNFYKICSEYLEKKR